MLLLLLLLPIAAQCRQTISIPIQTWFHIPKHIKSPWSLDRSLSGIIDPRALRWKLKAGRPIDPSVVVSIYLSLSLLLFVGPAGLSMRASLDADWIREAKPPCLWTKIASNETTNPDMIPNFNCKNAAENSNVRTLKRVHTFSSLQTHFKGGLLSSSPSGTWVPVFAVLPWRKIKGLVSRRN